MNKATFKRSGKPFGKGVNTVGLGSQGARGHSRSAVMASLGPVVYAARLTNGVIKIGWTTNFEDRLRYLAAQNDQDVELIGFQFGTREDEQEIHAALRDHLHHGREYYHATEEVLHVVNQMRDALGMPPIAA